MTSGKPGEVVLKSGQSLVGHIDKQGEGLLITTEDGHVIFVLDRTEILYVQYCPKGGCSSHPVGVEPSGEPPSPLTTHQSRLGRLAREQSTREMKRVRSHLSDSSLRAPAVNYGYTTQLADPPVSPVHSSEEIGGRQEPAAGQLPDMRRR